MEKTPATDAAVAAAGAFDDVCRPFSKLRLCDRGFRDLFEPYISEEVKGWGLEMKERLKKLDRVEHDLSGFMYLSPHQKLERPVVPEYTRYHISNPGKEHVSFYCEVKLGDQTEWWAANYRSSLDFMFLKVDGHWKLKNRNTVHTEETNRIQITVKHAGFDEWTPVELFQFDVFPNRTFNTHKPEDGTNFGHGDQINMRYIDEDGRSWPVSFDRTEKSNYFPITICIM